MKKCTLVNILPERHGQASDGRLHNELPRAHGHAGSRALLPAQAAGDNALDGVSTVSRAACRHQQHCCHPLLHGLQPGGQRNPEHKRRRAGFLPIGILSLVQGRGDEASG